MIKISHLQKVLIVMLITVLLAFDIEKWWHTLFIGLYFYYFTFILNLFTRMYVRENRLTKFLFEFNELPLIISCVLIFVFIVWMRKQYPSENFDGAYLNAFVGAMATAVARYKRGKVVRKS